MRAVLALAEPPGPHVGQDAEDVRAAVDVPNPAIDDNDILYLLFALLSVVSKNGRGDNHKNRFTSCYVHFDGYSDYAMKKGHLQMV